MRRFLLITVCLAALLFPAHLSGQFLGRDALSNFPADTQQLAYTNLAELRGLPNYPKLRERLLNRQMASFEDLLRSMGMEPERDTDEVVMGWRGDVTDASAFFGLAAGRFEPQRAHDFYARSKLPARQYEGLELYAFGSGQDRADWFFAFPTASLAVFGRLNDVKAVLDTRAGTRPALDSKSEMVNWEAELEGRAPQWGLTTGRGAVNLAAPWLGAGNRSGVDPSAILGPLQAVLYSITWSEGFNAQLSFLCQSAETADALAKLLKLWQQNQPPMAGQPSSSGGRAAIPVSFSLFDVQSNGLRVELNLAGPLETLDPILRGPGSVPGR